MYTLRKEHDVAVTEIVVHDLTIDRPWFVMPWYSRGSLQVSLDSGVYRDDPVAGVLVLLELAEVLADTHSAGYAHRDLKPPSILVNDDDRLVLTDFGLCLAVEDDDSRLTATDEAIGSWLYIAPENEGGINESLDQRPADYYAYGKMLWALLSGRQPLPREQILDADNRLARINDKPALAPLDGLLISLISRDPRGRPGDWTEVMDELRAVMRGLEGLPPIQLDSAPERVVQAARRLASSPIIERWNERHREMGEIADWYAQLDRVLVEEERRVEIPLGDLNRAFDRFLTINATRGAPDLERLTNEHTIELPFDLEAAATRKLSEIDGLTLTYLIHSQEAIPELPTITIRVWLVSDGENLWMVRLPTVTPPGSLERPADFFMRDLLKVSDPWQPLRQQTIEAAREFVRDTSQRFIPLAGSYVEIVARQDDPTDPSQWLAVEIRPVGISIVDERRLEDTEAPQLSDLRIVPPVVELGPLGAEVICRVRIIDEIAGVPGPDYSNSPNQLWFVSPSGQEAYAEFLDGTRVSGDSNDGTYEGRVQLPRHAERGVWKLQRLYLVDDAGNDQTLTIDDVERLGFPTTFKVVDAAPDP